MKKLIFLLSFAMISFIAVSQEPATDNKMSITSVETVKVNPTVEYLYNDLTSRIDSLAIALKVPAEHVWTTLVTQSIIIGWLNVGIPLLIFLIFLLSMLICNNRLKFWIAQKDKVDSYPAAYYLADKKSDIFDGFAIGFLVVTIIAFIVLCATTPIGLMHILNPDYYAIQDILRIL